MKNKTVDERQEGPWERSSSSEDEESTSDYSYGQIAASIMLEKRARKAVEEDTERLYNRVRQLEKEEEKARRRIVDTQDRANEILLLRQRNQQRLEAKEKRIKEMESFLEKQREENLKEKRYRQIARVKKEINVLELKQTIVQKTKGERVEIERLVAQERLISRKKALEQKQSVRKAQIEAGHKIEVYRNARMQLAHNEYERKLRDEVEARIAKEKELSQLIRLEVELIERLKERQNQQRVAFQHLEMALQMGNKPRHCKSSVQSHLCEKSSADLHISPSVETVEPTDQEVAQAFAKYDVQGMGYIKTSNIEGLLQDLGINLKAQQLKIAIAQLDMKDVGQISFGEFILWWKG